MKRAIRVLGAAALSLCLVWGLTHVCSAQAEVADVGEGAGVVIAMPETAAETGDSGAGQAEDHSDADVAAADAAAADDAASRSDDGPDTDAEAGTEADRSDQTTSEAQTDPCSEDDPPTTQEDAPEADTEGPDAALTPQTQDVAVLERETARSDDELLCATEEVPADEEPETLAAQPENTDAKTSSRAKASNPKIQVLSYARGSGWQTDWTADGKPSGSAKRNSPLEGLRMRLRGQGDATGTVQYRVLVDKSGWRGWTKANKTAGMPGKELKIQALQVRLTGSLKSDCDVWYRVNVKGIGWMAWAKNGEAAGTAALGGYVRSVQVTLRPKDDPDSVPSDSGQKVTYAFNGAEEIRLRAHVQRKGWLKVVGNAKVAGTTGQGLRLEALKASLSGLSVPGQVQVRVYVHNKGWQRWRESGKVAGTTGKSLCVEAVRMRLTGEAAAEYELYYRVHVQKIGWLSWAKASSTVGTTGMNLGVEAVQAKLVRRGAKSPSNADAAWKKPAVNGLSVAASAKTDGEWGPWKWNGKTAGTVGKKQALRGLRVKLGGADADVAGHVRVRVHTSEGWGAWASAEGEAVTNKNIDAVQIKLTGDSKKVYDVWYRAHAQSFGWMGWTRNGRSAGTVHLGKRLEAVQVRLVSRGKDAAPGSTYVPFRDGTLQRGLDAAKGGRSLAGFGGYELSGSARSRLDSAIASVRNRGYDLGFIMMDLSSLEGVAYNCDALFYGASSIKAPYIISVASAYPDSVNRYAYDMTQTLFYSWDYNYKQVLNAYGKPCMRAFLKDAGVRTDIADSLPWAHYTPREFAKMWARSYQLYANGGACEQVGRWCERPNVSTIHTTLGSTYRTRTKAGWIDGGGARYANINGGGPYWKVSDDGGIVYARKGAYVVAIMSAVPANHDVLNPVIAAIDAAHNEM